MNLSYSSGHIASAPGTKPSQSPIIDSRINRSILKNYVLLRDTFLFPPASISPYSPVFRLANGLAGDVKPVEECSHVHWIIRRSSAMNKLTQYDPATALVDDEGTRH